MRRRKRSGRSTGQERGKSRFTSTGTSVTYQECVSDEGRLYYMTMCYFYEAFMKLGEEDPRRVKLNEK